MEKKKEMDPRQSIYLIIMNRGMRRHEREKKLGNRSMATTHTEKGRDVGRKREMARREL